MRAKIRLLKIHHIATYKGKSLICTHQKHIAIWVNEKEVSFDNEYLEFSIDQIKSYQISNLQRVLCEPEYKASVDWFKGSALLELFNIEKALAQKNECV